MKEFLAFLSAISGVLQDLFVYVTHEKEDPEAERQLALRILREARNATMRRELGG